MIETRYCCGDLVEAEGRGYWKCGFRETVVPVKATPFGPEMPSTCPCCLLPVNHNRIIKIYRCQTRKVKQLKLRNTWIDLEVLPP